MTIRKFFKYLLDVTMTDTVTVILENEIEPKELTWEELLVNEYEEYYEVFGYFTSENTLFLKEV